MGRRIVFVIREQICIIIHINTTIYGVMIMYGFVDNGTGTLGIMSINASFSLNLSTSGAGNIANSRPFLGTARTNSTTCGGH